MQALKEQALQEQAAAKELHTGTTLHLGDIRSKPQPEAATESHCPSAPPETADAKATRPDLADLAKPCANQRLQLTPAPAQVTSVAKDVPARVTTVQDVVGPAKRSSARKMRPSRLPPGLCQLQKPLRRIQQMRLACRPLQRKPRPEKAKPSHRMRSKRRPLVAHKPPSPSALKPSALPKQHAKASGRSGGQGDGRTQA